MAIGSTAKGYVLAEGGREANCETANKKLFMRNLTSDQHFCMYCIVFAYRARDRGHSR